MSEPGRARWRWGRAARIAIAFGVATAVAYGCSAGAAEAPTAPESPTAPATPTAPAPADVYLAPDGHDEDACLAESPCLTLQRAYEVAEPGQAVELAAGEYPGQSIDAAEVAEELPEVVFRPAAGAAVSFSGRVEIFASGLELRDMSFIWYVNPGASRVTLRNIVARGSNFITSASRVRVIGGEIGPGDSTDGLQIKRAEGEPNPTDILIDGVYVHDFTRIEDPTDHTDCVQVGAAVNLTISGSRFHNCATQGVFFRAFGGGRIANVVIENNWFGTVLEGFYPLILQDIDGALVRYNSSTGTISLREGEGLSNVRMIANVGPYRSHQCADGVVYERNVWSATACSESDVTAPSGFVDAEGLDLRLTSGAAAIDGGDPADFPATDILGRSRPMGAAPDAGAHEAG